MSSIGGTLETLELGLEFSQRFRVERQLGEGGNGIVHLAYDEERHQWVALKELRTSDPQAIYRFKKEFRALSDVRHPNLIELYELFSQGERWLLTMEHLEGEDLLDHLHGTESYLLEPEEMITDVRHLCSPVVQMRELRRCFLHIAMGLQALHGAGTLHRDLKPANVMVTTQGRVVVLDFGIAAELNQAGPRDTRVGIIVGTPAYMSPEQAFESARAPTCDWYAFGAMLYEALTGELPIDDIDPMRLLQRKFAEDPQPPSSLVRGVPKDLEELCVGLLARDPAARPSVARVIEVLSTEIEEVPQLAPARAVAELPFVGRQAELTILEDAVSEVEEGSPVLALLHGPSGMGKSALAQRLLQLQRHRPHCVVLAGRCFEHESVAFKAFDSVVDALTRYLGSLPELTAVGLLPLRLEALLSVFPVLTRVQVVAEARKRSRFQLPADPAEVRRLAFAALRELLCRLSEDVSVIIYIDDLQWGDVDSVELIEALIGGGDPAPVLVLGTYRSEELERSPCLRALSDFRVRSPTLDVRDVELGGLSASEARALTELLSGGARRIDTAPLVADAQGSPYLLAELIRFASDQPHAPAGGLTVSSALARRIEALSPDARALLSLLSIAGRPLPRGVYALLRQDDVDLPSAVAELRTAKLVRSGGAGGLLTTYHDRVRETIVAALPQAERVRWHGRLLSVLEARAGTDMETLAYHCFEACEHERGARYAVVGAQRAMREFAFDRATRLYQLAIERATLQPDERRRLLVAQSDALVLAGRRADAAAALKWAAENAPPQQAAEFKRRAGEALVLAGHSDEGLVLLGDALRSYGQTIDKDEDMAGWFERRRKLAERGLGWVEREASEVSASDRRRLDTLWAVGFGLFRVEGVRVHHIAAQYLLDALEMGDRYDVVRGLCFHTAYVERPVFQSLGRQVLPGVERAQALTEGHDDPRCRAWILLARGFERWLEGHVSVGALLLSAHDILQERCAGSTPERGLASALMVNEFTWRGQWIELQKIERWQADASSRRDVALRYTNGLAEAFGAILGGRPADAGRRLERLRAEIGHVRFEVRFPVELLSVLHAAAERDRQGLLNYVERCERFLLSVEGVLPRWRHENLLMRVVVQLHLFYLDADPARLDAADQDLCDAISQPVAPHEQVAMAFGAMLALARGERDAAIAQLREAVAMDVRMAKAADIDSLWADVMRHTLGALLCEGRERGEGKALVKKAARGLQARGIQSAVTLAGAILPGTPEGDGSAKVVRMPPRGS